MQKSKLQFKIKSFIPLFFILIFAFYTFSAFAVMPPTEKGDYTYRFFLYYDKGQLLGDRDYEIKYEVVPGKFTQEVVSDGAYKGEIRNFKGDIVKTFQFDPQGGKAGFTVGKIIVQGPYVADGMRVGFYNSSDEHLISIFVRDSSFCNDDLSCDAAKGEDTDTCPVDCKKVVKKVGAIDCTATPNLVDCANPAPENNLTLITIIYVAGAVGAGLAAWFGWKWIQKKHQLVSSPETSNFFENNQNGQNS